MARSPMKDPRTIARDIPGILDTLFPQLAPGVVLHLNGGIFQSSLCEIVPNELVLASKLQYAMLFELGFAVGESLITCNSVDWAEVLDLAVTRQRSHYDAKIPQALDDSDRAVAEIIGSNLDRVLHELAEDQSIECTPKIPGFQWISSGVGDFSYGRTLVEVKCTGRRFGASDYRQILMYWLLSYAAAIEGRGFEWIDGVLINPRRNEVVLLKFDQLISTVAAGRTKVELLELFSWLVGDYGGRSVAHG